MSVLTSLLTSTRPGGLTLLRRVALFWYGVDNSRRSARLRSLSRAKSLETSG